MGVPVPADDLPASGGGGAAVPANDLPGAAPSAVTQPQPTQGSGQAPDQSPNALGPGLSNVVRPILRGANMILNFVPDIAASTLRDKYGISPQQNPNVRNPSEYWDSVIDKYTTRPTTTMGKVGEAVNSMLVGGGAQGGLEEGMGLATQAAQQAGRITSRAAEAAHAAGYKLPPSYVGGAATRTIQTMAGGPKVEKAMSAANEAVTDRLAQVELGLHPEFESNALSEETFEALKAEAYQPYEQLRALGQVRHDPTFFQELRAAGGRFANRQGYGGGARFPSVDAEKAPYMSSEAVDAGSMVDEVRQLRSLSRQNLKQYNPEANAVGYTQREIANAIENQLSRAAQASGNPTLMDRLRAARVQLSKIAAVEDSMGAGGHVRADDLRRMMDAGTPLTGNLQTIADTAKNFPKAVQHISKQGETGVWSAVDYLLGGTGIIEGHPGIAALSVARPVSRWALGTGPVQSSMVRGLNKAGPTTGKAVKGALARGAVQEGVENPDTWQ